MGLAPPAGRDHRRRHQRQGLDLRHARAHPARGRLPRRAATPRRTCCATTSACASHGERRRRRDARRRPSRASRRRAATRRSPTSSSARWRPSRSSPRRAVEVAILEVGLGGRLDAVNIVDADCAIVTSVDLDHQDYLGDTREAIGFEKAGIFRARRAGDLRRRRSRRDRLVAHARAIGADLQVLGRDFGFEARRAPVGLRRAGAAPSARCRCPRCAGAGSSRTRPPRSPRWTSSPSASRCRCGEVKRGLALGAPPGPPAGAAGAARGRARRRAQPARGARARRRPGRHGLLRADHRRLRDARRQGHRRRDRRDGAPHRRWYVAAVASDARRRRRASSRAARRARAGTARAFATRRRRPRCGASGGGPE